MAKHGSGRRTPIWEASPRFGLFVMSFRDLDDPEAMKIFVRANIDRIRSIIESEVEQYFGTDVHVKHVMQGEQKRSSTRRYSDGEVMNFVSTDIQVKASLVTRLKRFDANKHQLVDELLDYWKSNTGKAAVKLWPNDPATTLLAEYNAAKEGMAASGDFVIRASLAVEMIIEPWHRDLGSHRNFGT
jgi:hypothetical protein